eukprot:TRINITY_DN7758_c0_g1_i2.p1 TRINITY_DN7758_c0_g1~~TRINITY_DN7758_c0_g1_i2.p1  ORF type:complete len:385 (+),score=36.28 TRINITY_DN7758_c0_g1_i2:76-1230(+)
MRLHNLLRNEELSFDEIKNFLESLSASERSLELESRNPDGRTAIYWAPNEEIASFLVDQGASVNVVDKYGQTVVHFAASRGFSALRYWVESRQIDLDARDQDGRTALHYVPTPQSAQWLIDGGANVEISNQTGLRPLHIAVGAPRLEIVRLLLRAGANVNAGDNTGATPLHLAAKKGHFEIAALLLEEGAAVSQADNSGWTALHYASLGAWPQYESHTRIVKYLLEHGADVNVVDAGGWTALHCCTDASSAKVLMEYGIDIVRPDAEQRTPLHFCSPEIAVLLLDRGVAVDPVDKYQRSPLHLAPSPDKVRVLLARGGDLNRLDCKQKTPLDYAVNRQEVFGFLREQGAKFASELPNVPAPPPSNAPSPSNPVPAPAGRWCLIQ